MSLLNDKKIIEKIKIMRNEIKICSDKKDGRVNSGTDDENAKKIWLSFGENFGIGEGRSFYDLSYKDDDGKIHYINFKSSDLSKKAADNLNAKEAILISFTNLSLEKINECKTWAKVIDSLIKNKKDNSRDYYYIIFDKKTNKFIFTSVKSLDNLIPNGSNLPYQCRWFEHTPQKNRSFADSYSYITSVFRTSLEKRAKAFIYLQEKYEGTF
jgi:hypothetical protein